LAGLFAALAANNGLTVPTQPVRIPLLCLVSRAQLVERGTHAQFLALDGLYATLYHTQFKKVAQLAEVQA